MEYKDYYKTLGVEKNRTKKRSRKPIGGWRASIILM